MTSCVAQKMPGTPPLTAGPPLFLAAAGPLSLQRLEPPAADRLVDQLAQIALAEDERLERTPTTTTLSPPAEDPSTSDSSPAVSSKSSPDSPSWAPAMPVRDMADMAQEPHLEAAGFFMRREHPSEGALVEMREPSRFSGWDAPDPSPAPLLGEHDSDYRKD